MTVKSYGANVNLALDGTGVTGTDIAEEFGGNDQANVKLSDYYAGGSLVPAGTNGYPGGGSAATIPSSGQISFRDFFASASTQDMPSGTYTGRTETPGQTSTYVTYLTETQYGGAIAEANVQTAVRLVGSIGVVEIQVARVQAQDSSLWYNTSNSSSSLSTTWQTIWQMNLLPDSVKWRIVNSTSDQSTGAVVNSHAETNLGGVTTQLSTSYQTINTSTTLGRVLESNSRAECYGSGTALRYWGIYFDFRKSGYNDEDGHAEFVFRNHAVSISTGCV